MRSAVAAAAVALCTLAGLGGCGPETLTVEEYASLVCGKIIERDVRSRQHEFHTAREARELEAVMQAKMAEYAGLDEELDVVPPPGMEEFHEATLRWARAIGGQADYTHAWAEVERTVKEQDNDTRTAIAAACRAANEEAGLR